MLYHYIYLYLNMQLHTTDHATDGPPKLVPLDQVQLPQMVLQPTDGPLDKLVKPLAHAMHYTMDGLVLDPRNGLADICSYYPPIKQPLHSVLYYYAQLTANSFADTLASKIIIHYIQLLAGWLIDSYVHTKISHYMIHNIQLTSWLAEGTSMIFF